MKASGLLSSDSLSLGERHQTFKADSHIACRARAVPLPCRAAKGLECVFPIWFTQCGRVWFTLHIFMNQTRPHCVIQMGKTHSKPLAARHGRGTAWARHAMCESAFRRNVAHLSSRVKKSTEIDIDSLETSGSARTELYFKRPKSSVAPL
jgi:hypothetical protein